MNWPLNNWLNDADIIYSDYNKCENCKVHTGFFEAYLNVQS